ncbi:Hypothetical predicted protein [Xyrichtys novacula]|uniref:Uncharacterized protein n=1 Tax=Xyrichtys novacula TaxID=13765 RepID=A0AAV1H1T6_XYRNO|nr:Hypothetical predicted protein [Xyrichtys novacula]
MSESVLVFEHSPASAHRLFSVYFHETSPFNQTHSSGPLSVHCVLHYVLGLFQHLYLSRLCVAPQGCWVWLGWAGACTARIPTLAGGHISLLPQRAGARRLPEPRDEHRSRPPRTAAAAARLSLRSDRACEGGGWTTTINILKRSLQPQ